MATGVGRALVLGGGGVAGVAWEAGLLTGLREAGVDLSTADLIVGTSAGSIVGGLLTHGVDVATVVESIAAESEANPAPAYEVDMDAVMNAFAILFDPNLEPQEARRQVGRMALDAPVAAAERQLEAIADRMPSTEWPARPFLITAVDAETGEFTVWDRDSGVPLPTAVVSSCAVPLVFPPVEINGRRYMDGGTRSVTNADLARGASAVVIIEPLAHLSPRTVLEAELRELEPAPVAAIGPDETSMNVFGADVLDQALWRPAFKAGLAQAAQVVAEVRTVWNS